MRTGVVGLFTGLLALVVLTATNVALYRWGVRRFAILDRRRPWFAAVLVVMVLLGPTGRLLANGGYGERWAYLEATSNLWGLTLIVAMPLIFLLELVLARLSRGSVSRQDSVRVVPPEPVVPETLDRRDALSRVAGTAVIGASLAPLVHGVLSRFDFEVVEVPIRLPKLPRTLDGFTIVQVSDIHVGVYLGEAQLRRAEDQIGKLRPDLVVMTGDLVHLRPSYLPLSMDWVRRLGGHARLGALSILGNHEYYVGRSAVLEAYRRAGLELLINAHKRLLADDRGGIVVAGVDDLHAARSRGLRPDLDAALAGVSPDAPRILLAHQPQFHDVALKHGVDVQLSGHTHGGQIAPLGPIVARAVYGGRHAGLFRAGDAALYVNRGFGTSGPPARVAVRPEITKIVLVAG